MKRILLIAVIILGVAAAGALAVWLNAPRSFLGLFAGMGYERHPVDFDIEFAGIAPSVTHLKVDLSYYPQTPIYGISEHWSSWISPPTIDQVYRTLDVPVQSGHVRFQAPLGLAGLSTFRLTQVQVGESYENGGPKPYFSDVTLLLSTVNRGVADAAYPLPPRALDVPLLAVSGGELRYDGPHALWPRSIGAADDNRANAYTYEPRIDEFAGNVIWDGLRTFRARVDLTLYPLGTFAVPQMWEGMGWTNTHCGNCETTLVQAHSQLTRGTLSIAANVPVHLPFARECVAAPQFAAVAKDRAPAWSQIDGLWRPVPRHVWQEVLGGARASGLEVHFVAAAMGHDALEPNGYFEVLARAPGTYRLLAACSSPHYASLGVTWIDVVAR